jgi:hypothetical protein
MSVSHVTKRTSRSSGGGGGSKNTHIYTRDIFGPSFVLKSNHFGQGWNGKQTSEASEAMGKGELLL